MNLLLYGLFAIYTIRWTPDEDAFVSNTMDTLLYYKRTANKLVKGYQKKGCQND